MEDRSCLTAAPSPEVFPVCAVLDEVERDTSALLDNPSSSVDNPLSYSVLLLSTLLDEEALVLDESEDSEVPKFLAADDAALFAEAEAV